MREGENSGGGGASCLPCHALGSQLGRRRKKKLPKLRGLPFRGSHWSSPTTGLRAHRLVAECRPLGGRLFQGFCHGQRADTPMPAFRQYLVFIASEADPSFQSQTGSFTVACGTMLDDGVLAVAFGHWCAHFNVQSMTMAFLSLVTAPLGAHSYVRVCACQLRRCR